MQGYQEGQRVIAGAICPSFTSYACQDGYPAQDGGCQCHGYKPMGGWRFGNSIDGTQAEYVLVPDAQANLAPVPDGLSDEQVLMCPDIMSTGFAGAEAANIKIGDVVAVFAQGPIGLCATAGAKLRGASTIIAIDGVDERLHIARQLGADVTLNFREVDVVDEIFKLTGGRGVDASIEALGLQSTFEQALRVLKPGGTLSSLGVYSSDLTIPLGAFHAGLGDHRIVTSLCPGARNACAVCSMWWPPSASTSARWSLTSIACRTSSRPTTCSPISVTAYSRWRSSHSEAFVLRVADDAQDDLVAVGEDADYHEDQDQYWRQGEVVELRQPLGQPGREEDDRQAIADRAEHHEQ